MGILNKWFAGGGGAPAILQKRFAGGIKTSRERFIQDFHDASCEWLARGWAPGDPPGNRE